MATKSQVEVIVNKEYQLDVDMTLDIPEGMNLNGLASKIADAIVHVVEECNGTVGGSTLIKEVRDGPEE